MERIKPSDLENAELKKAVRGYDVVEVHKLLQKAAQEIATLNYEIRQLKSDNEKLSTDLNPLQEQASCLTDVMLSAQKMADENRAKAQKEADKMLIHARREADHIVSEAKRQAEETEKQHVIRMNDLKWQIERCSTEKDKVVKAFREILDEQVEQLDELEGKSVYTPTTFAVVEGAFSSSYDSDEEEIEYDTAVEA